MIVYLLKSIACLLLLYAVYRIFLEGEKMHRFNRYFLLFSLVIGLTIPLITIEVEGEEPTKAQLTQRIDKLLIHPNQTSSVPDIENTERQITKREIQANSSTTNLPIIPIAIAAYSIIVLLLLRRFFNNLYAIFAKARKNKNQPYKKATLVLVEDYSIPCSFFKYIFINKNLFESGKVDTSILDHELKHVSDKHSLDILFIELLKIFFWFNPVLYLFKKTMQLNHEFLADESVVSHSQNVSAYQKLLLKINTDDLDLQLVSSINYSITKKRLVMMTKKTSQLRNVTKKLSLIPLIAVLIFAFSNKIANAQNVEDMSLPELITALSSKVEAADSFSSDEQKALSELIKKLRIKMPPPPPKPKKVKTPAPPVKINYDKHLEVNKNYNKQVRSYKKIPVTEENREKLKKVYNNILDLKTQLNQLYEETYGKVKNPPPPPPTLKIPNSPDKRIQGNNPPPPVKKDTTKLKAMGKEYIDLVKAYQRIEPNKTNKAKLEDTYASIKKKNKEFIEEYRKIYNDYDKEDFRISFLPMTPTQKMLVYYRQHPKLAKKYTPILKIAAEKHQRMMERYKNTTPTADIKQKLGIMYAQIKVNYNNWNSIMEESGTGIKLPPLPVAAWKRIEDYSNQQ